jgi:hypothetical protein
LELVGPEEGAVFIPPALQQHVVGDCLSLLLRNRPMLDALACLSYQTGEACDVTRCVDVGVACP